MPAPAFLKSGPAVTSFGIFGTGAVGVGGWQVVEFVEYENSWPVAMAVKFPNGNPKSNKLGLTEKTETVGDFSKAFSEKYDCFNGFFEGARISHDWWEDNSSNIKSIDPSDVNWDVNPPSFQGKKDLKGCALMQLSHNLKKDDPYWSLKAEIAVKNEKIGWALWILGEGSVEKSGEVRTQYSQHLHYRLALLEWAGGKWNARMGYFWDDVNVLHEFNIKVIVPENETWINQYATTPDLTEPTFDAFSDSSNPSLKEFSGEWIASEDGKEIFEDMSTSSYNDSEYKKGILGNKGGFSDSEISAFSVYHPKQEKWVVFDKDKGETKRFDPKDVLDAWYSPFKGKKGKWQKFN